MLNEYWRELRDIRDFAGNTIRAYIRELECFSAFLKQRDKTFMTARREDFIDFKASIGHRAANGIAMAIKAMRSFYGWLEESDVLRPSPLPKGLTVS